MIFGWRNQLALILSLLAAAPAWAQQRLGIHMQQHLAHRDDIIPYARIDSLARALPPPPARKEAVPSRTVIGYLPYWRYDQYADLNYNLLTEINFFGVDVNTDGTLGDDHNWPASNLISYAQARGVKVKLSAILFNGTPLTTLLSSATNRQRAIDNLLAKVQAAGGDGIDIDFEGLPSSQRDNMVTFMQDLTLAFHTNISGSSVTMAVPAVDWNGAWDLNALAQIVDGLFIMAYDYHWRGGPVAGPVSPLAGTTPGSSWNVTKTVDDYLSKTAGNAGKLILGIPYYGWDWPVNTADKYATTSGSATARFFETVFESGLANGAQWDANTSSNWYNYQGGTRQVWYDDSLSISLKYQLALNNDLAGVGMWALGFDGDRQELWGALSDHFGATVPPLKPTVWATISQGDGTAAIDVLGGSATSYNVYQSTDGSTFTLNGFYAPPDMIVNGLPADTAVYLKIQAANASGASPFTEVLGTTTYKRRSHILIVNGFDRTQGTTNTFDFIRRYGPHLARLGIAFDAASNEAVQAGSVILGSYNAVIWILGEEADQNATFNGVEQALVAAYLEGGGQMLVSGSEVGYDLVAKGTANDAQFYRDYLKAQYIVDAAAALNGPGGYAIVPETGSLLEGLPAIGFDDGTQGTYHVDWPDGIKSGTGATLIASYQGADAAAVGGAGIAYAGRFGSGSADGRLVYLAVGFEAFYPAAMRDSMMARFMDFFQIDSTGVAGDRLAYVLGLIYPNPSRLTATVPYELYAPGQVRLVVYNLLGQEVRRLVTGHQEALAYTVIFNPVDHSGAPLASGLYIVALTVNGGKPASRKVTYIK